MEVLFLLKIRGMKFPLDRKYYIKDGAHIWLKSFGNFVKIGIDAFATEMAGSIKFLNISKRRAKIGEAIGTYESAKFVSKFYSPINGKIIAVNDQVINNPQKINDNPYNSWIVAMKPDNNKDVCEYIIEGKDEIWNWISNEVRRVEGDE
jgi:glycine cleavage system H protein